MATQIQENKEKLKELVGKIKETNISNGLSLGFVEGVCEELFTILPLLRSIHDWVIEPVEFKKDDPIPDTNSFKEAIGMLTAFLHVYFGMPPETDDPKILKKYIRRIEVLLSSFILREIFPLESGLMKGALIYLNIMKR